MCRGQSRTGCLGRGVPTSLRRRESGFGERPGCCFIADGKGVRDLGIRFGVPPDKAPAICRLQTAHPLDAGTAFGVRLDRSEEGRTDSHKLGTAGTRTLMEFPGDPSAVAGGTLRGRFELSDGDRSGRRVSASRDFDFRGRRTGKPARRAPTRPP